MTPSSGNVFEDVGFRKQEAVSLELRSFLMFRLEKFVQGRGFTQRQAAAFFGVTQPRISNLVRGRIDLFSLDMLVDMLARAGIRVEVVLEGGVRRLKGKVCWTESPEKSRQGRIRGN
jgi:predicted XRE-type DNA-binding protein